MSMNHNHTHEAGAHVLASSTTGGNVKDDLTLPDIAREIRLLRNEQRTANLIAWHGVIDSEDQIIEDLYAEIYTRLELGNKR